jgi:putative hydroxymethylpyrimidine transport system substrate-binding protein
VLRSVVTGDGGDPDEVRTTTIGFEAVKALLAGRVAGATAF